LHSPRIAKIEVEKRGAVRRARLNYLRTRKGKSATTVKEKARATAEAAA
jgi:large subunit ribosomal protein L19